LTGNSGGGSLEKRRREKKKKREITTLTYFLGGGNYLREGGKGRTKKKDATWIGKEEGGRGEKTPCIKGISILACGSRKKKGGEKEGRVARKRKGERRGRGGSYYASSFLT